MPANKNKTRILVVPQRKVQGGLDFKFESSADPSALAAIGMSSHVYTSAIEEINDNIRPSRSRVNVVRMSRARSNAIEESVRAFNIQNPELKMRWDQNRLTIGPNANYQGYGAAGYQLTGQAMTPKAAVPSWLTGN